MRSRAGLIGLIALIARGLSLAPPAGAVAVSVKLVPATLTVAPLDTFTVQVAVDPADSVFNAFDVYLVFDSSKVEFVSTVPAANQIGPLMTSACGNRFHLFVPHPTQLDMTCSLLCSNVFVNGPGVIYQVKFRVKPVPGATTTLAVTPATTFYKAGFIMLPLGIQGMTLTITDVTGVGGERAPGPFLEPPIPNPGSGASGAAIAFTLAAAGAVRLDLFDAGGRRVGGTGAQEYPAGRSSMTLPSLGLATGAYWIRLTDAHGRQSSRPWVVVR
jgi:hypothetical protein